MDSAIELQTISMSYEDRLVLDDVSFSVSPGETKVLLGGSGSGKSTVLKIVLGLIKPDSGRILIEGEEVTDYSEDEMIHIRKKVGMVFQEGALFDSLTVYENVGYRLFEQGVPEIEIQKNVRQMLDFVNLEHVMYMMPAELSGGMRRRVGIARALIGNPRLMLYDEPTAGLDPPTARTICELAMKLRDLEGASSIFVTHKIDDAKLMSSGVFRRSHNGEVELQKDNLEHSRMNTRFIMLKDGKVIFSGPEDQLLSSRDPYIQDFLRM